MSKVSAVIVELLSTPLNTISLSLVADFITKSEESLLNLPNSVPASFNKISAPSASNVISPATSNVKSAKADNPFAKISPLALIAPDAVISFAKVAVPSCLKVKASTPLPLFSDLISNLFSFPVPLPE